MKIKVLAYPKTHKTLKHKNIEPNGSFLGLKPLFFSFCESENEMKTLVRACNKLHVFARVAALDNEQLKKLETQKKILKDDLITAITGRNIFIRDKPKYYHYAVRKLDYIEEHFGSDIRRIVAKEFEKLFTEAYQGITGKAPTFKMGIRQEIEQAALDEALHAAGKFVY